MSVWSTSTVGLEVGGSLIKPKNNDTSSTTRLFRRPHKVLYFTSESMGHLIEGRHNIKLGILGQGASQGSCVLIVLFQLKAALIVKY